jgi:gluconokinase
LLILVMGVSGAGKTTVGAALARSLGWTFLDADDFHPPANVEKMAAGHPLAEEDRAPWLDALAHAIAHQRRAGRDVVVACSALRRAHRERLTKEADRSAVVYLAASPHLIERRLARRTDHFMDPALAASQFDTLEPPADALVLDARRPPDALVRTIRDTLGLHAAG